MGTVPDPSVLFLCTGNSCRSQMAEGWLRHLAGDRFECLSAGTEAHGLNPRAVESMAAAGVDVTGARSKTIDEFRADPPDLVVTVCGDVAESCPAFQGATRVVHWPFPDPAGATGTDAEIQAEFAAVRDAIRARIEAWLAAGAPFEEGSARER